MPTRQLHIAAGNSAAVPVISLLRLLGTKSAGVVKTPRAGVLSGAVLATAMATEAPDHPITRAVSIVSWAGGDRRIEDQLLAPGAFDRVVVWGSADTVRSVRARAAVKTIVLAPRVGLSLIGHEAFPDSVRPAAVAAAADAMIDDQQACTSALVHYVEGTEAQALDYCRVLQEALAGWDRALPPVHSRATLGRLRGLRSGALAGGRWFENGAWPATTSVVIYLPTSFDLSLHPMSRCVMVRRVDDLREAVDRTHPGIAAVGVYPEHRRLELADELAARGVSRIFPLGECEQTYPGMPHDGMRVLSELVNWVNR